MKYAVIGAGLAGLVAAREISVLDKDAHVDVLEADDRIGGKLYTVPFDNGPVDVGAEAFLAFRQDAVDYFTELGLAEMIVHPSGLGSLIYSGGSLHPMPHQTMMGIPSASAALGGLVDEKTAAVIDAEADQEPFEWTVGQDASIGELVRARFGDQVVERVVCAFLGGVYSCHADDLGIRATVPQLAAALDEMAENGEKLTLTAACKKVDERRRASQEKQQHTTPKTRPVFGSFDGGYAVLYEELAEQIRGDIYLDCFITGIVKDGDGFIVKGAPDGGRYDKVVVTAPAPMAAKLISGIAPEAGKILSQIKLASSVVVGMRFASDEGLPQNSGVLVATDEDLHAKAFTFSSRKWPHLDKQHGALVRASFGRLGDETAVRTDEDQLVDWALDDLEKATGFNGRDAGVEEIFVQRWFGGIPQYGPGHNQLVADFEKAFDVDGVVVAGSWAHGVGVPAVIADARAKAEQLVKK